MSTTLCPSGHASLTDDYCDQCGALIHGPPGEPGTAPVSERVDSVAMPTAPAAGVPPCPACGAARGGPDRFCEDCGYDFVEGVAPAPAAAPVPAWEVEYGPDPEHFARMAPEGVEFPRGGHARVLPLGAAEVRIGRGRPSDPSPPDIDLATDPADPAVSRLHAALVLQDDGAYAVVDKGSTNGTMINGDTTCLAAETPVRLADGDRVHVGAWTTITLRRTGPDRAAPG